MLFAQPSRLRLDGNKLCGLNMFGDGTYTAVGIVAICDVLKVNSSLTSLSYVPRSLNSSPKCQDPLTSCFDPHWQPRVQ